MKTSARFGPLTVGRGSKVVVMAAINLSPESFFKGSVARSPNEIASRVEGAIDAGADVVDLGAMSSAPYLNNEVSEEVEMERIRSALDALSGTDATISVDTMRASVAELALRRGAAVINDVSGLKSDDRMKRAVKEAGASLLVMAHSSRPSRGAPVVQVRRALRETLEIAEKAGIEEHRIVVDPGIGFFREEGAGRAYSPQNAMPWYEWDVTVLSQLSLLESLGRPVCVGVSRKSFVGKISGSVDASHRLPGSIAATALAIANGADIVRTHDVAETVQAVRVVEAIVKSGRRGSKAV